MAVALGPDGKIYAIGGYGGGSNLNALTDDLKSGDSSAKNQSNGSNCLKTAERYDFNTG